ncbi:MAG TPA: hypothetical protein VN451_05380, partial [Chitinophagaceae bacterium]|nr:hypothetical protein [Chitinophagaceae bacterium]
PNEYFSKDKLLFLNSGGPPFFTNNNLMSTKSHHERYFVKLLIGFAAIITGVMVIFYAMFEVGKDSDWYFWAIVAAFLLCGGIYFALSAMVHKIKADFSRRQKQKDSKKSVESDF